MNSIGSKGGVLSMYRERVAFWLRVLRGGGICYQDALRGIQINLQAGNLTLQECGANEDELKAGRKNGCKANAEVLLERLRMGSMMSPSLLSRMHAFLAEGELALEDIGTTQAEIDTLVPRVLVMHDALVSRHDSKAREPA